MSNWKWDSMSFCKFCFTVFPVTAFGPNVDVYCDCPVCGAKPQGSNYTIGSKPMQWVSTEKWYNPFSLFSGYWIDRDGKEYHKKWTGYKS